jgi:hypothetical protein
VGDDAADTLVHILEYAWGGWEGGKYASSKLFQDPDSGVR